MTREMGSNGSSATPPFVAGGGGFEYEDDVAAFVLAAMLAHQPPFGEESGLVRRVDWQTEEDGWEFDDLLLTCCGADERKIAISCKSGTYVTSRSWPKEAVQRLWQQKTRSAPNPFRESIDLLAVVTGKLAQAAEQAWDRVVQEALATDPHRFMERFAAGGVSGENARQLVESLQCPPELAAGIGDEPSKRAMLIRQIRLWRRDLLSLDSADVSRAVDWCRHALTDGGRETAVELYDKLRSLAAQRRIRGGTLELRDLVGLLTGRYSLKCWPNHESAWRSLDSSSDERLQIVSESIGDTVCLTQAAPMATLLAKVVAGRVVFVEGESGTGKSALAKRLALRHSRTLWLFASDLDASSLYAVAQGLGSSVPLTELLDQDRVPSAMLVIDGAERLSAAGRRHAARLICAAVKAARPWLVVVTTHEDGVDRLLADLGREPIEIGVIHSTRVELPSEATVEALLPSLPISFTVKPSRSLLRVLRNLKAMDWTVRSVKQRELAGFPDLVEQVWNSFLGSEDENARANVLKAFGRADADSISGGTPRSMLAGADDQRVAQALVNDGLLVIRNERYFFRHDLLGDWARLLLLVENGEQASEHLKEVATNIRWAPAIRLFAEWLSQKGDIERAWLVRFLVADLPQPALTSLLEGLFRSPDGGRVLDELLSSITFGLAEIETMLRTFMAAATRPSDLSMVLRRDHPVGAVARASYRTPIPELWSNVTQTLESHAATLGAKVPVALGHVARVWLLNRATAQVSKYAETSRSCATLAVTASRELQARLAIAGWSDRQEISRVFEGLLLAAAWLAEDAAQIALELSHRRPNPPAVVERVEAERKRADEEVAQRLSQLSDEEKTRRRASFSMRPTQHRKRKPFVDGPSAHINEAFRSAVLETAAIVQLAIHMPEAGQEVLLACCLEDPGQDDPLYLDFAHDDHTGTIDKVDWYPPLYLRGPWLPLLLASPEQGLEAVLRLVGVGTSEWLRLNVPPEGAEDHDWVVRWSTVVLEVGGEPRQFRGGAEVFGWYRGHGRAGNIVTSALMALESWLYQCMDADQPVDRAVETIFESGNSVALIGVLAALARRHPELLNGSLRPLMSSWMLLDWDDTQSVQAQMPDFDPLNLKALNTWIDDEAEKWSKLPHRAVRLCWVIATKLAMGEDAVIAECERARTRWQEEIDSSTCLGADNAKRLVALLDPANLSLKRLEEGQVLIEVEWPPDLAEKYEERSRDSQPGIAAFQLRSTMRKLLEAGQPLNETQAEEVWRIASSLPADPSSAEELEVNSPVVARAAAAAALELLAAGWLDGFPDRRAWCESAVSDLAIDQPRRPSVIHGVSVYKEHAEAFAGEWAIGRLAAGDERPEVRRILAEAITPDEPIVIGQVMKAAVDVAEKLPNDFERLFNLLWLWCTLRNLASGWRGDREWSERIAESRRQKIVQAFVDGRIPNELMAWDDLRLRAARVHERSDRRCRAKSPFWTAVEQTESSSPLSDDWYEYDNHGFSWSVLERIIEQLPVVVRPSQRSTLGALIEFDRRLLDLVVFTLKCPLRDHRDRDSLPNQFDRLALSRLCLLIADHEDDEVVLDICKQMMPLLPLHAKWCEAFFDAWFRHPREGDSQSERFYRRWQSMIEMAESMPAWESGGEQWSYDLQAARSALLGVHERGSQLGTESDQSAIGTLRSVYADWAEHALADRWRLRTFCSFLQKPGASDLRLPALRWIRSALERLSDYLGSDRDLVDEVAGVCIVTWYQHREQVLGEPEAREAMIAIIQLLWQMGVQEIAEVKEELEGAIGQEDKGKP